MKSLRLIPLLAAVVVGTAAHAAHNVILITLDGVRWQDILPERPDPMLEDRLPAELKDQRLAPKVYTSFSREGMILGDETEGGRFRSSFRVTNGKLVSLPGYRSLMTGRRTAPCENNHCGYWDVTTLPERLVSEGGMRKSEVAVFGSWATIRQAAVSAPNAKAPLFVVNTGEELAEPGAHALFGDDINEAQASQLKGEGMWEGTRRDRFTWLQALEYLKEHPRFIYISFNDTDSWAHLGRYDQYARSLRYFDNWFEKLEATLKVTGYNLDETTFIVTTDHGRGDGVDRYLHHGQAYPEAARIWLFAKGAHVHKVPAGEVWVGSRGYEQPDVRPTIEALLGLCPVSGDLYGRPIPELIEGIDVDALCAPKLSKRKSSEARKPAAKLKPKAK